MGGWRANLKTETKMGLKWPTELRKKAESEEDCGSRLEKQKRLKKGKEGGGGLTPRREHVTTRSETLSDDSSTYGDGGISPRRTDPDLSSTDCRLVKKKEGNLIRRVGKGDEESKRNHHVFRNLPMGEVDHELSFLAEGANLHQGPTGS